MKRYVCIHGHFYQPPRENPWLEAIEVQEAAYPFHDWNERINAECYEVNGRSRILDGDDRIVSITNNYARISFNFGPTLLSWLEHHAPHTYEQIIAADRESAERFGGHGSAIAQVYNHMIMPLANVRDKRTQVQWGIADFRKRFDRDPLGMWLPETAVDLETLDVLAEHDIQFTILAPKQAGRVRRIGEEQWQDVSDERIDPTRPYVQRLPSGRSIVLFFYDGPVSQALAFEHLLNSSEQFYRRLHDAFPDEDNGDNDDARLAHIATDGESYGHHHRHGDMALAAALKRLDDDPEVELTNYAAFLDQHPPQYEVEIIENTSWSCVHGVERWRNDCGCHSGRRPEWSQKWRKPLRDALDWLRDELAGQFEERAGALFADPWAARDHYIDVVLDRTPGRIDEFLSAHAHNGAISDDNRVEALLLMELQRNLMLMYTSCGWFFDDISGIETVQVIRYAGRAIQLAEQLFADHLEERFLDRLERAPSNVPEFAHGRTIYERFARQARVDLATVAGHYAMSSLFEEYAENSRVYCYAIESKAYERVNAGRAQLAVGRARVNSTITGESELLSFGVLHLGDHNLLSSVRAFQDDRAYEEMASDIKDAFSRADVAETVQRMDRHFGEHRYTLRALFRDEQRKILSIILDSTLATIESAYRHAHEDNATLLRALGGMGVPIPSVLRTTAEFIINLDLERAFSSCEMDMNQVRAMLDDAQTWNLQLDTEGLGFALQQSLERAAVQLRDNPDGREWLDCLNRLTDLVKSLPFEVDLWMTQNICYDLLQSEYSRRKAKAEAGDATAQEWVNLFRSVAANVKVRVE